MKYKYLIAYSYEKGIGRAFMSFNKPLNTVERMLKVEENISKEMGIENALLLNVVKLKK